jgi:prephenate dehydrogenase
MALSSVKIVGSGLIGTSIGLALASHNVRVLMADHNAQAKDLAQSLVDRGPSFESNHIFDVVIFAVPPSAFGAVLKEESALNSVSTFVDVMSIKTKPLHQVEGLVEVLPRYVGTHPMAGREVSGAQSARGDLFRGRPWIVTSNKVSSAASMELTLELINFCGGIAIHMDSEEHDQAMALISHVPQLLASLLAGELVESDPKWLGLIGQGFKDLTRIADSDSLLWKEIISENSSNIATVLSGLRVKISELEATLKEPAVAEALIESGNKGRALIPGKHGSSVRSYVFLHIVIDDKAGQLAAIFNDCAAADVNIEDVSIEHTPGQNTGLVTLSILDVEKASHLEQFLGSKGWKVHSTRN